MQPIKPIKLAHSVRDALVALIRSGEFAPGSRMPSERELMSMLGVGRPAIREAMQALERMGLIVISHGARAQVAQTTPTTLLEQFAHTMADAFTADAFTGMSGELEELREARLFMETGLARLAATRATAENLRDLDIALEQCHAAVGDRDAFIAADMAFHAQIAAMSGNHFIAVASDGLLRWLSNVSTELVHATGAETLTLREHTAIRDAIASGNPDRARRAMYHHLLRTDAMYAEVAAAQRSAKAQPLKGNRAA